MRSDGLAYCYYDQRRVCICCRDHLGNVLGGEVTAKKTAKPMSARKLDALKRSIANWEKRAKGELVDKQCPLCALYYDGKAGDCVGCPVFERTGYPNCEGTPYQEWSSLDDSLDDWQNVNIPDAKRELRFLKSLLPKEAK